MSRGNFGSKLGIILATAGSAVGLGNVWRFPYMTGQNGGAAFLLMYIGCIMLLGIPGMLSEFLIGRHGQANAVSAYDKLSGGRPWKYVGYVGIFTATIILGFYAVVAGWCLEYLFASLTGRTLGDADYIQNYFVEFSGDMWRPMLWGVVFIVLTHMVIVRGVRKGIERASKWLMPILMLLLLILVVASCCLPNAIEGVRFLLMPDFSKVDSNVFLEALGQPFKHSRCVQLHLRQLLQARDKPAQLCRTDSHPRHSHSHTVRFDDIPCGLLRRHQSRQRSVTHLYHAAERLPASLRRHTGTGIRYQHHVLCPARLCSPHQHHLHARDRHSFLYRRAAAATPQVSMDYHWHRLHHLHPLRMVGRCLHRHSGARAPADGLLRQADGELPPADRLYTDVPFRWMVYTEADRL